MNVASPEQPLSESEAKEIQQEVVQQTETQQEISPEVVEDIEDVQLTESNREALQETAKQLRELVKNTDLEGETKKEMLENVLQQHFDMSIAEFLAAMKPTFFEVVGSGGAMAGMDALVRMSSFVFGEKPADLSAKDKVKYRARICSKTLKPIGAIVSLIPGQKATGATLSTIGAAAGRVDGALTKLESDPKATSVDVVEQSVTAALPHTEDGQIDQEATNKLLSEISKSFVSEIDSTEDETGLDKYAKYGVVFGEDAQTVDVTENISKEDLRKAAEYVSDNPDQVVEILSALAAFAKPDVTHIPPVENEGPVGQI